MIKDEHLLMLWQALVDEFAWQEREHRRLLGLSMVERVLAGVSWSPLKVDEIEPAGRGRNRVVLKAERPELLHDGISAGNPVMLAPTGSPDDGVLGTCLGAEGRFTEVLVYGKFDDEREQAVTRQLDRRTFDRYRTGLALVDRKPSLLGDVLLGREAPQPPLGHWPKHAALDELNPSQQEAAEVALRALPLALIHGPPGTGKTQVITAILQAFAAGGQLSWALADSNAAVDHLALRASHAGLDVIRLGHPARIASAVAALTLPERIRRGPMGAMLRELDRDITKLGREGAWAERRRLLGERDQHGEQAKRAALESCDVIASTFGTLVHRAPELPRPAVTLVDEATQAIEPAIWTAVPWTERLILVGDPEQLGPVVMEPGNPLERSLLQRLLDTRDASSPQQAELPLPMLRVQHRMNESIQELIDDRYDAGLEAHPSVSTQRLVELDGVKDVSLTSRPTLWVDTAGAGFDEFRDPVTQSIYNEGEIRVIRLALRKLLAAGVKPEFIGIIAPYGAQVTRLKALPDCKGVEVATVNGFQGREMEAILCSFVRSNEEGQLGFVADGRRLTVALSRARRFLLCTGDSATLSSSARFAHVLDVFQKQDAWSSVWEEPWSATTEDVSASS